MKRAPSEVTSEATQQSCETPHFLVNLTLFGTHSVTSGFDFAFRLGLRLCLAFGDRFLHNVRLCESFLSSSRSSMIFSPAVGYALVLPAVGYVLVLPAVGCVLLAVLVPVLLSSFFSPLALWLKFCLCFL